MGRFQTVTYTLRFRPCHRLHHQLFPSQH